MMEKTPKRQKSDSASSAGGHSKQRDPRQWCFSDNHGSKTGEAVAGRAVEGGKPPQTITSAVIPSLKSPPPVTIDLLSQGGDSAPSPLTFAESTSSAGQSFNIDEYQLRDAMVARLNKKSSTQNGLSYEVNQMLSVVEGIIAHRETLLNLAYLAEEEMKLTRAKDDKTFPEQLESLMPVNKNKKLLFKKRNSKTELANLMVDTYFILMHINRCTSFKASIPGKHTDFGKAFNKFEGMLTRVKTTSAYEVQNQHENRKALKSAQISGK